MQSSHQSAETIAPELDRRTLLFARTVDPAREVGSQPTCGLPRREMRHRDRPAAGRLDRCSYTQTGRVETRGGEIRPYRFSRPA